MGEVNKNIENKINQINKQLTNIGVNTIEYTSQTDLVSKSTSKTQEVSELCVNEYTDFIDVSSILDSVQSYITQETQKITEKVNEKFEEMISNVTLKATQATTDSLIPTNGIASAVKTAQDIINTVQQVKDQIQEVKDQITDKIEKLTINANIVGLNATCFAIEKAQKAKEKLNTKNKLSKLRNKNN